MGQWSPQQVHLKLLDEHYLGQITEEHPSPALDGWLLLRRSVTERRHPSTSHINSCLPAWSNNSVKLVTHSYKTWPFLGGFLLVYQPMKTITQLTRLQKASESPLSNVIVQQGKRCSGPFWCARGQFLTQILNTLVISEPKTAWFGYTYVCYQETSPSHEMA